MGSAMMCSGALGSCFLTRLRYGAESGQLTYRAPFTGCQAIVVREVKVKGDSHQI